MAQLTFDTTGQQPMTEGATKVPAGEYLAKVVKSELTDNSKGTGKVLKFEYEIIGGDYAGSRIRDALNWENPNPTAVEIGRARLTSICLACNKIKIASTEELHGVPMKIKVALEDNTWTNSEGKEIKSTRNNVTSFSKATTATAAPKSDSGDAPW